MLIQYTTRLMLYQGLPPVMMLQLQETTLELPTLFRFRVTSKPQSRFASAFYIRVTVTPR